MTWSLIEGVREGGRGLVVVVKGVEGAGGRRGAVHGHAMHCAPGIHLGRHWDYLRVVCRTTCSGAAFKLASQTPVLPAIVSCWHAQ